MWRSHPATDVKWKLVKVGLRRVGRSGCSAIALILATMMATTASASATSLVAGPLTMPVDPALTTAFVKGDGLTTAQAERRVLVQQSGAMLNQELEQKLGSGYAGVWYNESTGRVAVGVAPSTDAAAVDAAASSAGVTEGEVEKVPVKATWAELISAQNAIDAELANLIKSREVSTGLYTPDNAVSVDVSANASPADQAIADSSPRIAPNVKVEVDIKPAQDFDIQADACTTESGMNAYCDRPMRGATYITGVHLKWHCSSGLLAKHEETYYMMTAGHCIVDEGGSNVPWIMYNSAAVPEGIGDSGGFVFGAFYPNPGGTRDSGAIQINTSSYWHSELNAYAFGGAAAGELYPTLGIAEPYVGLGLCHLGVATPNDGSGTNCGSVLRMHVKLTYEEGNTLNDMTEVSECGHHGDSGGPNYANNIAYGLQSGGKACPEHGGFNSGISYIDDAGTVQYEEGVTLCRLGVC